MERCHSDGTKYISGGELQLRTLRSLRSSTVVTSVLLQHSVLSSVMSLERVSGEVPSVWSMCYGGGPTWAYNIRQEWSDGQASLLTSGEAVRSVGVHLST